MNSLWKMLFILLKKSLINNVISLWVVWMYITYLLTYPLEEAVEICTK